MTPRKILVLHGFAQSGTVLQKRMGAVRKACKGVELVYIDAPHVLTPADLAETFNSPEELGAAEATETDPALQPRAWWKTDAERTKTVGAEESFAFLRDILSKDHYDGIFGFSQGACMAAWLTALLERPETFPPFLVDGKPPHPPFQFCVAVAGFKPNSPLAQAIIGDSISTPVLHVIGRNDVIVVEERSQTLLDVTPNKRVEYHDGGHFVPSKANWRAFFRDYLLKAPADADVPSPSASTAASQPASGAATPVPAPVTA